MPKVAHICVSDYVNDNFVHNKNREKWLLLRLKSHQRHIDNMIEILCSTKDDIIRGRISIEIGFSRNEIDNYIKPELERIRKCQK